MKEALLEPLLRRLRIRQVLPILLRHPDCSLLDIGCGREARLLRAVEPYVTRGTGVDFKAPSLATPKLTTLNAMISDRLPFPDAEFDVVTLLAVLEHLSRPGAMVKEIARVLKPGGQVVLTVPSFAAKPVLEFLAYRVGIVSEAEIRDHKCYYNRQTLQTLFAGSGLIIDRHRYFQLGMNNFLVATRVDAQVSATPQQWRAVRATSRAVGADPVPSLPPESGRQEKQKTLELCPRPALAIDFQMEAAAGDVRLIPKLARASGMSTVSAIMAAYSILEFVEESGEAILRQTLPNFELSVVDDAPSWECPRPRSTPASRSSANSASARRAKRAASAASMRYRPDAREGSPINECCGVKTGSS